MKSLIIAVVLSFFLASSVSAGNYGKSRGQGHSKHQKSSHGINKRDRYSYNRHGHNNRHHGRHNSYYARPYYPRYYRNYGVMIATPSLFVIF